MYCFSIFIGYNDLYKRKGEILFMKKIEDYSIEFMSNNHNKYHYFFNSNIIMTTESLQDENKVATILHLEKSLDRKFQVNEITPEEVKRKILENSLSELVIEVTTNCNLRCSYCIFGDDYKQLRQHGFKNIDFETAKSAIDMYFNLLEEGKLLNPNRTAAVSFYGGEPLINFDIIKKCIKYIKSIYDEELFITMTTNATLLNDEMIEYFKKNNVTPLFSIDGPKSEHDKHRQNANGQGSFDLAIKNMKKYSDLIGMPAFVTAVLDVDTDLRKVIKFFADNEEAIPISLNPVSPINTNYYDKFTDKQRKEYKTSYNELWNEYIEGIAKEGSENDRYLGVLDLLFARRCNSLQMRTILNNVNAKGIPYTATCIPGERLFVDLEGNIYPCEKISRSRNLGNVKEGLDFAKIADYMNDYNNQICKKCEDCKLKYSCPSCFNNFLNDKEFVKNKDLCQSFKASFLDSLQLYVTINEANPKRMEKFKASYYESVKEMVVTMR